MGWADRVIDVRSSIVPSRTAPPAAEQRYSLDQLSKMFSFGGSAYPFIMSAGSSAYDDVERDEHSFIDYVNSVYKSNGVIFGIVLARIQLFAEARFQFQRMRKGRPGDLYGTEELFLLEKPWPNGTTGELLARMEQDVSIGGNAYVVREAGRLRRLRPDWVQIILNEAPARAIKSDVVGYLYTPGGGTGRDEVNGKIYLPNEICHWSPIPDPEAQYRGMSWLTPVLSEIQADQATTRHKLKFFENAATPNLAVSFSETVTKAQFEGFMAAMNASHQGSGNAYKTLYLGGGADVKVIGADLRQLDFKSTQGAGETRICAAGGVPPIIVGLSEGLQSATYSNYGMARRKFGDHWARPQWRSVCSALERIIQTPRDSRLWYDDRDIAFLREDQKDVAAIQSQQAGTMKQLLDAGYTPESVMAAVTNEDWTMLEHSGLYSVQLQPPGQTTPSGGGGDTPPGTSGAPEPKGPPAIGAPAKPDEQDPAANPTPVASPAEKTETKALLDLIGLMQRQIETLTDQVVRSGSWDPKDHPRGPDGKFGTKPGGGELTGLLDSNGNPIAIGQVVLIGKSEATVVGEKDGDLELSVEGLDFTISSPGDQVKVTTKKADPVKSGPSADLNWQSEFNDLPDPTMTPRQRKAAFAYVHDGYKAMNGQLRGGFKYELGEGPRPDYDADLGKHHDGLRVTDANSDLADLIEEHTIDRPLTVYRGISLEGLEDDPDISIEPDGMIYDPAFLSTSMNRRSAEWFVAHEAGAEKPAAMIEISVPSGSKGIKMPSDLSEFSEGEILFAPGSTLNISEVTQDGRTLLIKATIETR